MADEGMESNGLEEIAESANVFASNFLKNIARDVNENFVCSPISASMVLSMAAYGARGNTETQMRQALALPADDALAKRGFRAFVDSLRTYEKVELHMANKMFMADRVKLKDEFQAMARKGFDSEVQIVNFLESTKTSEIINDWCIVQTKNRIKNAVKPGDFTPDTALVLLNAVYFKGNWAFPFDIAQTTRRYFHIDITKKPTQLPTMYRFGLYNYGILPEFDARYIELPYESKDRNDAISMIIVLPNTVSGLPELMENKDRLSMKQLLDGNICEVHLYLPKFKIESYISLNQVLIRMGMSDAFTDKANFTGIADGDHGLGVSSVIQKAFIEVNEEGSEAAAVTSMECTDGPGSYEATMNVNRPFLFSVVIRSTGLKIFEGCCRGPYLTTIADDEK